MGNVLLTPTAPLFEWSNGGLAAVQASLNSGDKTSSGTKAIASNFTSLRNCMAQCAANKECQSITYAQCGNTPLPTKPSATLPLTKGSAACNPSDNGANCISCAKQCFLWNSPSPGGVIPWPQKLNAKLPNGVVGTTFMREPDTNDGFFVVLPGIPKKAVARVPSCCFLASRLENGGCAEGYTGCPASTAAGGDDSKCLPSVETGLVNAYAEATKHSAATATTDAKLGFVMDATGTMYGLLDAAVADVDGNVDLVPAPRTTPAHTTIHPHYVNRFFTYLRAQPVTDRSSKWHGHYIVRVNGEVLDIGRVRQRLTPLAYGLIAALAVVLVALLAFGIGGRVHAARQRKARAHTAVDAGMDTLAFVAHPDV